MSINKYNSFHFTFEFIESVISSIKRDPDEVSQSNSIKKHTDLSVLSVSTFTDDREKLKNEIQKNRVTFILYDYKTYFQWNKEKKI